MAKRKELTVSSWPMITDPEPGEQKAVLLEDLTPEQDAYYRKLRTERLIEACQRILNKDLEFAMRICHDVE